MVYKHDQGRLFSIREVFLKEMLFKPDFKWLSKEGRKQIKYFRKGVSKILMRTWRFHKELERHSSRLSLSGYQAGSF